MEQNSSNQPPPPMMCRSGCGFYGSPSFEGMCSKCFKDTLKRRQQNTSPTALLNQTAITAAVSESAASVKSSSSNTTPSEAPVSSVKDSPTPGTTASSAATPTSTTPSVETASPTVPSATAASSSQDKENGETADAAQADSQGATAKEPVSEESPSSEVKKPKKNKCHTCKKKVGLTGFQCRCGGLYCSMHRYSDKHDCQFDYKELAQQQIRKQNPVVVGQKVQKI